MKTTYLFLIPACLISAFLIFTPRESYAKARCPMGITQEDCCGGDPRGYNMTVSECASNCSGTCSSTDSYYAGCAKCLYSIGDAPLCRYDNAADCNATCSGLCMGNITTGCWTCDGTALECDYLTLAACQDGCLGTCAKFGLKCYTCTPGAIADPVVKCPDGTTLSSDKTCCFNN